MTQLCNAVLLLMSSKTTIGKSQHCKSLCTIQSVKQRKNAPVLVLIAAQTSSPVPDPQNAQMITVNHQLSTRSSLSLSLIYLLVLTLISSNYNFLTSRYPHMYLDQGCRSHSILPSRMGECGVSFEHMENMKKTEKMENMEMFFGSPTEMFSN